MNKKITKIGSSNGIILPSYVIDYMKENNFVDNCELSTKDRDGKFTIYLVFDKEKSCNN